MKRRVLSVLLALVLALTLLPSAALATTGGTTGNSSDASAQASSAEAQCENLNEAWDGSNGVYKLTKDVALKSPYEVNGNLTIDFNGYKITADGEGIDTAQYAIDVTSGKLIFKDSSSEKDGTLTGDYCGVKLHSNTAFELNDVTISNSKGSAISVVEYEENPSTVVENDEFSGNTTFENTAIVMNSGKIIAFKGAESAISSGNDYGGKGHTVTINGGTIECNGTYCGIGLNANCTLTINNCTYTMTNTRPIFVDCGDSNNTESDVIINNIDFAGTDITTGNTKPEVVVLDSSAKGSGVAIRGGTFNIDPTTYVDKNNGYVATPDTENTKWTVALAKYTVTTNPLNGEKTTTQTVNHGSTLTLTDPTREGYTFDGWYNGDTKWTVNSTVTGDLTLIAHWTKNVEKGTNTKTEVTVDENGTVTEKVTDTTGTSTTVVETKTTMKEDGTVTVTETKTATDSTNNVTTTTVMENNTAEVTATISGKTVSATTKTVNLDATTAGDGTVETTKVTLAAADATKMNNAAKAGTVEAVKIKTDVGTLTIDKNALKTITEKATSEALTLVVEKKDENTTTGTQTSGQSTTKTTATYELTAKVGDENVFVNSPGKITVTVDWPTAPGFRQQLVCYCTDGGKYERMSGLGYHGGQFSWDTNHFSTFEIKTETIATSRAYINLNGGSSSGTTSTTTTTVKKADSATTFDAGVGIYAVSAILSVTGMAWVGKKKH